MAAPNAWMSYALGSETLFGVAPTDADLTVEAFEPTSEAGKFDFTVSVKDVEVGGAAQTEAQKAQVKENLKQVFGLEGTTSLDDGTKPFSSGNVDITFGDPEDGKVKFTTGPKDAGAKMFFMKVFCFPWGAARRCPVGEDAPKKRLRFGGEVPKARQSRAQAPARGVVPAT